ncbi:MAG TPA: hypothetical protein VEC96_10480 [Anaerolineae bacterium]|nr:hypothetical protein [Anaerolineae bacterium]
MSKTRRRTTTAKPASKPVVSPLIIGLVAAVAILIVGGLIVLGNQDRTTASIDLSQFPTKGNATASVTMIDFSDYG